MPRISIFTGNNGFAASSTAEDVTNGINATGLTAIVTGPLDRIGFETARVLAVRGVHVIMTTKNLESGKKVKETLTQKIPNAKIDVMELDMSSQESIRHFASHYRSKGFPLNILILNAGIDSPSVFTLSKDHIELTFATNHVGNFLLTNLLSDTMKNTAKDSGKEGRVVILSAEVHRTTYKEGIRFDKINDKNSYNAKYAYSQSKLANVLHAKELARQFQAKKVNITANAVHPGILASTAPPHGGLNGFFSGVVNSMLKNAAQAAATTCYVALSPQVKGVSGEYFTDSNLSKASDSAQDAKLAKRLWDFSLTLTKSK